MKNYIASTIAATGLIIFIFGIEGSAQSTRLVADIPFDFYVRSEKLPAGKYEFQSANRHSHPGAIIVRSLVGSARRSIIVPARLDSGSDLGEIGLTFNRYGTVHYLAAVDGDMDASILRLSLTRAEKQLAKEAGHSASIVVKPADSTN